MTNISRWKKEQKELWYKKQKKVILSFSLLVLLILTLASGFRFCSGLRSAKIKNLDRVNFVINTPEKILIVSLSKKNQMVFLSLPLEKKIMLTRGFGKYAIGSIFNLGELDNKGSQLLKESLQEFLGIPIDGIISSQNAPKSCQDLEAILWKSLWGRIKSSFSEIDLLILWLRGRRVLNFELKRLELAEMDCYDSQGEFDQKKLDINLNKYFQDEKIIEEGLAVAIFNGTDVTGFGSQFSRLIVNFGGRIIAIGNSDLKDVSVIKANKENSKTDTYKRLIELFNFSKEEGVVEDGRADIGIYLGKDYWKKLNEKW